MFGKKKKWDKKQEDKYRKKNKLISIKDEAKARKRLHKRRKKSVMSGGLLVGGAFFAAGRVIGNSKDAKLSDQLDRLEANQERRERRGEPVFYPGEQGM